MRKVSYPNTTTNNDPNWEQQKCHQNTNWKSNKNLVIYSFQGYSATTLTTNYVVSAIKSMQIIVIYHIVL